MEIQKKVFAMLNVLDLLLVSTSQQINDNFLYLS